MQCSVFNLTLQIAVYHPTITGNKYNNVVPPGFLLYIDTPENVLNENHPFITQSSPGINN